jgi:hypothetical protein
MDFILIETLDDFHELAKESEKKSLECYHPRKGEAFYLFRGANRCFDLLSSIQVHLKVQKKVADWQHKVQAFERSLVNRFVRDVASFRDLHQQYGWFFPPEPRTDTFWYLSVMQHYGFPTRLCDFTSNFWTAIFFAADEAQDNSDLALYRVECLNDDLKGNKLPRGADGNPWGNANGFDVNELLGHLIGWDEFSARSAEQASQIENFEKPTHSWGWDAPHFQNARLRRQSGFFVYNIDIRLPLEESLASDGSFKKYKISAKLIPEIRNCLKKRNLIRWKVYLDLDRASEEWKKEDPNGYN